ncbi:hypothetical protein BD779DRAFT_693216 [Infundibulicybe gibba]|nr:hypothetical protein BD779DRAFT_693216 [Infundibulicybe gibba]
MLSLEESRDQLIKPEVGIISAFVGLISSVGVTAFPVDILEYDDIRAAVLNLKPKGYAVRIIVTSMLDRLADSDDCIKAKVKILSKLADYDVANLRLVERTIAQHLPAIRKNIKNEQAIKKLEKLYVSLKRQQVLGESIMISIQDVQDGVRGAMDSVQGAVDSVQDGVRGAIGSVQGAVDSVQDGVRGAMGSVQGGVQGAMDSVQGTIVEVAQVASTRVRRASVSGTIGEVSQAARIRVRGVSVNTHT